MGELLPGEAPDRSEQVVDCSNCGLPMLLPQLVTAVRFPEDIDLLAAICHEKLNVVDHFCGAQLSITVPVVVANPKARLVVVANLPDDEPLAPPTNGSTVRRVAGYAELAEVLMGWLRDAGEELFDGFRTGALGGLESSELALEITPIRLLAMDVELAYRRTADEIPAAEVERFVDLRKLLIGLRVGELVMQAARESALSEVATRLAAAVPVSSLDDDAIAALVERCVDDLYDVPGADEDRMQWLKDFGGRAARAFRAELALAAACRLADRQNPREKHFAQLIVVLWRLSRGDKVYVDDRAFLVEGQLGDYLAPKLLWNAAAADFFPDGKMKYQAVLDFQREFAPLMNRVGFGDFFAESIVMNQAMTLQNAEFAAGADLVAHTASDPEVTDLGLVVALVAQRIATAQPAAAETLVQEIWTALLERGVPSELLNFVRRASMWLNHLGHYDLVRTLFGDLLDVAPDAVDDAPQEDQVDFWNEAGNTLRYLGHAEDSIAMYERARLASAGLPDEERRYTILNRNIAIVLRDSGEYKRAYEMMTAVVEANPEDHATMHSLAVLCRAVGHEQEAVRWLERALAVRGLPVSSESEYLIALAEHMIAAGHDDEAVAMLHYAWNSLPGALSPNNRVAVAALAIRAHPTDAECAAFRSDMRDLVIADELPATPGSTALVGARLEMALDALESGETADARRSLELLVPDPGDPLSVRITPVAVAWGWLRLLERGTDVMDWFRWSIRQIDSMVPVVEEASYARTWMRRVADLIESLLRLVPQANPEPNDLLALYELANGRELSSQAPGEELPDWVAAIRAHQPARPTCVIALLDGLEEVTAVVVSGDVRREPAIVRVALSAQELAAAVQELAHFDDANPVAPFRIDPLVQAWWRTAAVLAGAIEPHLEPKADLVILPGRALAAAPLHAAGWPEEPWIAKRSVSTCPNLRVLLSPEDSPPEPALGVVSVPKSADAPSFVQELSRTAISLSPTARVLEGLQATVDSVVDLAQDVDELVFLCHGISATGKGEGPGICLSAYGRLPPSLLPVEADPSLGIFALSWTDLVELERSPQVVVSIACATGRTVIGEGGTRLGLEQGFTSRGGGALVSPLWNVGQEGSLQWLRSFYDRHRPGDLEDIGSAHRAACLATMKDHPHPFAWAPFVLSRRLPRSSR